MAITYQGGQSMPAYGTAAYSAQFSSPTSSKTSTSTASGGGASSSSVAANNATILQAQYNADKAAGKNVNYQGFTPQQLSSLASGTYAGSGLYTPIATTPITSQTVTPQQPITLPQKPQYTDIGKIDSTGLTPELSKLGWTKDSTTGLFTYNEPKTEDQARQAEVNNSLMLLGLTPKKEARYQAPEVITQQAEVRTRQAEVNNLTAQLNAVTAKQNQDLLQLRGTGAAEGVTEAVYGGQQATINREAAIKALPIQAQIAGAQGNLQLAQQYLQQVIDIRKEQIDNDYNYQVAQYGAISNFVTKSEERTLQNLQTQAKYEREDKQNNTDMMTKAIQYAYENGQGNIATQIVKLNPSSPTFMNDYGRVMSGMKAKTTGDIIGTAEGGYYNVIKDSGGNVISQKQIIAPKNSISEVGDNKPLYNGLSSGTATAVRSVVSKFGTEPTIQNFATVQDGYNFASSLDINTKNPADDQALIYSLAKTLDPGSVVREGEYATAQKYSQSWANAYGKGVTQAIAGTGFLSKTARDNIKKTIEAKYNATKISYDKQYKEYSNQINNLTGRDDGAKFLRSYDTSKNIEDQYSKKTVKSNGKEYIIGEVYEDKNGKWTVDSSGKWTKL